MREDLKRIIKAHLNEKQGQNYVEPLRDEMGAYPFYNEQEQTYTDLTQQDSQHGGGDPQKNDKMFVYPEQGTSQPDWAAGDFQNPYHEEIFHKELWRTP